MKAVTIANKMIDVYLSTPVEKYPEARAIDVLDEYHFNDPDRRTAFSLFMKWIDYKNNQ